MKNERGAVGIADPKLGRKDDVNLKAFGIEINANGRNVILVLIAFGLFAYMFWHDYKSDISNASTHEAIWFQTVIIATPEKDRQAVLQHSASKAPDSVRSSIISQ